MTFCCVFWEKGQESAENGNIIDRFYGFVIEKGSGK